MSPMSKVQLQRIFNKLDRNGDGLVSVDELVLLLEGLGIDAKRGDLELLIGEKALDCIDFLFFCETLMKGSFIECEECKPEEDENIMQRDLERAFRVFDLDGDGFISSEELRIALSKLGLWDNECGHDCRRMIEAYDANSDGLLDFEEFKDMMMLTGQS